MFERFRKTTQCYRLSPGTDNPDGSFTEGSRTGFTIKCSKQPATADELLSLPEGRRSRESYVLYYETNDPLQTVETSETRNPDIVEISSEDYECVETGKWRNDVISHWRSIVQRLQPESGCVFEQPGGPLVADFSAVNYVDVSPDGQNYLFFTNQNPDVDVEFQDDSTGYIDTWDWDFGDESPNSSEENPTHTFHPEVGSQVEYTVRLTISKGIENTYKEKTITFVEGANR